MQQYIKDLKDKVEYCLSHFENVRNDDAILTLMIIWIYMPKEMIFQNGKCFVSTEAIKLVREDHVKRIRAKFQNEGGKYLPTDPDVLQKRQKQKHDAQKEWHKFAFSG